MTFTLTFSTKVNGMRQPLYINGVEASLQVDAKDRTGAIYHEDTAKFCAEHNASVRGVSP